MVIRTFNGTPFDNTQHGQSLMPFAKLKEPGWKGHIFTTMFLWCSGKMWLETDKWLPDD
jgi:hypothetical protein